MKNVEDFLNKINNENKRNNAFAVMNLMKTLTVCTSKNRRYKPGNSLRIDCTISGIHEEK